VGVSVCFHPLYILYLPPFLKLMEGLAVFTAILNSDMRSRFEQIPGYGTEFQVPTSAAGYRDLAALPEGETKTAVLSAFSDALRVSFLFHVSRR
jgi:hypothetical protein